MKIHCFAVELIVFCLIFLFFIVPPCFSFLADAEAIFSSWNFPVSQLLYFIIALLIYLYAKNYISVDSDLLKSNFSRRNYILLRIIFPFIFAFSILFAISLLFKFISICLYESNESIVIKPESFLEWLFCLLNFGFAAFYEEIIYRFYLTDGFLHLIKINNSEKSIKVKIVIAVVEVVVCILFAIGHLYMGILSFLNAILAHIVLRLCYKYSKNIYSGFAAHFLYNIISLILL